MYKVTTTIYSEYPNGEFSHTFETDCPIEATQLWASLRKDMRDSAGADPRVDFFERGRSLVKTVNGKISAMVER